MTTICHDSILLYVCKEEIIMIDKIFNMFFEKVEKANCMTVIKNREVKKEIKLLEKTPPKKETVKSELSVYFSDCKGLNVLEREKFSASVINVHKMR